MCVAHRSSGCDPGQACLWTRYSEVLTWDEDVIALVDLACWLSRDEHSSNAVMAGDHHWHSGVA